MPRGPLSRPRRRRRHRPLPRPRSVRILVASPFLLILIILILRLLLLALPVSEELVLGDLRGAAARRVGRRHLGTLGTRRRLRTPERRGRGRPKEIRRDRRVALRRRRARRASLASAALARRLPARPPFSSASSHHRVLLPFAPSVALRGIPPSSGSSGAAVVSRVFAFAFAFASARGGGGGFLRGARGDSGSPSSSDAPSSSESSRPSLPKNAARARPSTVSGNVRGFRVRAGAPEASPSLRAFARSRAAAEEKNSRGSANRSAAFCSASLARSRRHDSNDAPSSAASASSALEGPAPCESEEASPEASRSISSPSTSRRPRAAGFGIRSRAFGS